MKVHFFTIAFIAFLLLNVSLILKAQMPDAITITPENATVYDDITLTFDAELACYQNGSLAGLSTVAMHSGVTINGTSWQYSVSFNATGANGQSPVFTANPDGTFSMSFNPYEFYGFPAGSNVTQICAVFNNGTDWNQDGRDFLQGGPDCTDFFIPILTGSPYEPGLNSILPNQGIQGETVNVQIFGVNTNFVNGSTQIWIEKDAQEILMYFLLLCKRYTDFRNIVITRECSHWILFFKCFYPNRWFNDTRQCIQNHFLRRYNACGHYHYTYRSNGI